MDDIHAPSQAVMLSAILDAQNAPH